MKRQISISIVVCMLLAIISANTAMAINFNGNPSDAILDTGESMTFAVNITNALDESHIFEISGVDEFIVKVNGTVIDPLTWSTSWSGTASPEWSIEVTNVDAPNGDYNMELHHDQTVGATALLTVPISAIPEFPTIALPVAAILGLAFIFQRRREED